jgi:hypothetical protein
VNPTTGSIDTLGAGPWSLGASVGANNLTVGGATTTVVIPGNLQIDGTSTTVNTSTLDVEDTNITVNKGGSDATSEGSGLTVDRVGTDGSLIYKNTSATKWAAGSLGSEVDLVGISSSQTLTNKTLTSPVMNDYMDINEEASPATPSAGAVRFYAKSDKKLYTKDSNGVEQEIGSGSGQGEKNYIENPSASSSTTGWVSTDSSLAITRITTPSGLPREYTTGTGLQIEVVDQGDAIANNARITYNFTLDDVDLNKKLKIEWAQKAFGGGFQVYIAAAANTLIPLSSVFTIPSSDTVFGTSFDSTSTAALALVITAIGDTGNTLTISDVIVGPGKIINATPIGNWTSYTPTVTNWAPTASGRYRRVGDSLEGRIKLTWNGSAPTGAISVAIPSGLTIDTSALSDANQKAIGRAVCSESSTGLTDLGSVQVLSTTTIRFLGDDATGIWSATVPRTWSATINELYADFSVPIAQWASVSNYAGVNDVEYASNSDATGSANTTAFAYGPAGSAIPAITGSTSTGVIAKRVRFQTPIQATDQIIIQVKRSDTNTWVDVGQTDSTMFYVGMYNQSGVKYGIGYNRVSGSSTDIDVSFGQGGAHSNGATYASAGSNFPQFAGDLYRAVKSRAGAAVGFGAATSTSMGLIAPYNSASLVHSGTYTPTLTNITNVDASTAFQLQYMRVGASVTVSGLVNIDPSASGAIDLRMSLPPGLDMSADATTPAGGTAVLGAAAGDVLAIDKASTTTVRFTGTPTTRTNSTVRFIFMYRM